MNTVAKKRSSRFPRRSRSTPMNQRNAIPANGTRLTERDTVPELSRSHALASIGRTGTECRSSRRLIISKAENMMPATAAARGALRRESRSIRWCPELFADGSMFTFLRSRRRLRGYVVRAARRGVQLKLLLRGRLANARSGRRAFGSGGNVSPRVSHLE